MRCRYSLLVTLPSRFLFVLAVFLDTKGSSPVSLPSWILRVCRIFVYLSTWFLLLVFSIYHLHTHSGAILSVIDDWLIPTSTLLQAFCPSYFIYVSDASVSQPYCSVKLWNSIPVSVSPLSQDLNCLILGRKSQSYSLTKELILFMHLERIFFYRMSAVPKGARGLVAGINV